MNVTLPIDEIIAAVQGRKVGLLTNGVFWLEQAGDDLTGVVKRACRELVVLYGEHGPRGCEGGGEPSSRKSKRLDAKTRIELDPYLRCEIRNIAALAKDPDLQAISDLELLVVGMPDIGCRHYTYKGAGSHLMAMAAKLGKSVIVVDYPNPVGGELVEGNYPDPIFYKNLEAQGKRTFLWFGAPLTYRYGMTMAELMLMAKDYLKLDVDLRVIKLQGWRREMYWQDTGWPYLPLDPSIYTADTTLAFQCTGLFQGTSVSWGIGAANPFEVIGAPWIEDDRLLEALRRRNLPGVTWLRAHFVPRWVGERTTWKRWAGQVCNGVKLHVTDRRALRAAQVQLTLLVELFRLYPDKFRFVVHTFTGDNEPERDHWPTDHRLEDEQWADRLEAGEGVDTILAEWQAASRKFEEM
ncbi:MAG: DUF1343 domain-containing protein, partial [Planctomycetes bacterium]|nr:DUF1343 domain-containing protein [Planctomycetota bacterium]